MKINVLTAFFILFTMGLQAQTINHWETALYANNGWHYFRGTTAPPNNWKSPAFNHDAWPDGPGGIGFGDNDDQTVVQGNIRSLYIIAEFNVADTATIAKALLDIDYDDGFVAYINGIEVARNNVPNPANYNTLAFGEHEAVMYTGGLPERYEIPKSLLTACLVPGENILAVQIHNATQNSSDLSSNTYLSFGITDNSANYGPVPNWFEVPFDFTSSTLPIVVLTTNGNSIVDNPRVTIDMGIIDNGAGQQNNLADAFNNYNGKITIEFRGSSTQGFPKKQYGFSTVDANGAELNVPLLGLPPENDWILNAPYTDKTMIREFLTYNLAREMGKYASRTRYCEVVLDGQYQGVYILLEKVKWDDERVNISSMDSDDNTGDSLTGGYIFKIDKFTGSGGQGWQSSVSSFQGQPKNTYYQYAYPKGDEITPQQSQYLQAYVDSFENNLIGPNFDDPINGYHKFIDVESFIDFFLINEITKNVDGYRLSTFLHKQRQSLGGKLYAGPVWDFNITLGNADYCAGGDAFGWALDFPCDQSVIPFWWHRLMQDDVYVNRLNCRWTTLRQNVLNTNKLLNQIDSVANLLNAPQQRNYTVWPILGEYVWPNNYVGQTYQDELNYFKQWLTARLDWMDENMPTVAQPACQSVLGGGSLVVSEVNYHSDNGLDSGDWIELHNTTAQPLNVSGWVFKDAVQTNSYTIPPNTTIPANGYLVLVENTFLFQQQHPTVTNFKGPFNFGLGNSGDQINIFDNLSNPVTSFAYADSAGWTKAADGLGFTLELLDENAAPGNAANWYAGCVGGSPGTAYVPCSYPIVFSEVNYNSAPTTDAGDWVEIHNTTGQPINISGYSFADDDDTLQYIIPQNTTLQGGGYLVIYRDNALFTARHPQVNNKVGPTQFGLGGSGDACRLFDATGKLITGLYYGDDAPWPTSPDGDGYTLELLSETGNMCDGNNWFAGCPEGSPGGPYVNPCNTTVAENNVMGAMVYPNPLTNNINLQWTSPVSTKTIIMVFDVYGKLIVQHAQTSTTGINRFETALPNLPTGLYTIRLLADGLGSTAIRVIKM